MIELIIAVVIPILTVIGAIFYFKRQIPILRQTILNDVGDLMQDALNQVGTQLNDIFANPTIKKAYSVLGQKSGEVRADKALKERVASKVIDQSPVIARVLDYFEITPLEALQLMNDPLIQPLLARFLQSQGESLNSLKTSIDIGKNFQESFE